MIFILSLFANKAFVQAQTATSTASPAEESKAKQIEDLKERVATKVAELRNFQPKAISGKVKSQTVSTMTIETKTKDLKIELTDGIKVVQYLKNKRTKLTTDDVDNGDKVVVFGQYDMTIDILKAKFILIDNTAPIIYVNGIVKETSEVDFTLTVETQEGIVYIADVERGTKTNQWRNSQLEKGGFSKISIGDIVHIVGTAVPKVDKRVSAMRILDIGQVTGDVSTSPTTDTATPSPGPEITKIPLPDVSGMVTPAP